jgi:hypothetical protein
MSINSRPQRDDQQDRSDFLSRATAQDTAKLQCWIPSELHHWLKVKALDGRTNMTALVIEVLENYRREREG